MKVGVSEPRSLEKKGLGAGTPTSEWGVLSTCGDTRRLVPGVCVKSPETGTSVYCQDAEVLLG